MQRKEFRRLTNILHGRPEYKISRSGSLDVSTLSLPKTPFPSLDDMSLLYKQKALRAYAKILFAQYKLEGWILNFDTAKSRAGVCYGRRKVIGLSLHLIQHNNIPEINDTLLHEIAHAIDNEDRGYSDHSPRWVSIALAIGCNGKRCFDKDEKTMPEGKHLYACINCSKEVRYHKRKNNAFSCSDCSRKSGIRGFNRKFLFEYKGIKPVSIPVPSPKVTPVHTNLASANAAAGTKSERMKALYDSGVTSIAEIAKQVGAHYSHVHTVIKKHKG